MLFYMLEFIFIDKKKEKYPNPKSDLEIFEEHQKQMKFIRPLKKDEQFHKKQSPIDVALASPDKSTLIRLEQP